MAFVTVSVVLFLVDSDRQLYLGQLLRLDAPTLRDFLTSHLFHANGYHLSFNLVVIVVAGGVLEWRWGTLSFIVFYVLCALGAGAVGIVCAALIGSSLTACGASSVALGCLVAIGLLYPEHRLVRCLPPMKHLTWILSLAGATGLVLVGRGASAVAVEGAEQAGESVFLLGQLAGVPLALLFVRLGPVFATCKDRWRRRREDDRQKRVVEIRERVDELLDKITAEGSGSLTRDERAFLHRASKHFRKD